MSGAPSPGSQIGRFQLEAEVGRGAMGVVYRVRDAALNRPVALKLLAGHLDADRAALLRFHREATSIANLKHPNIAIVYEFGEHGGQPFIALEWVEGRTLLSLIADEAPLPPERALKIFDQVAAALDYAHSRNVIHRDIKPANIMIGPDDHATIVDFGLASLAAAPTITATGSIFGTPRYMSPEQIKGEQADGRSDLYSLAVTLYEMLAGKPPFESSTVPALLHHHLYAPPPPITELNPSLSLAVEFALTKALAKNPADRFQSGATFSAALRDAKLSVMETRLASATATDQTLPAQQTVVAVPAPKPAASPRRRWLIGLALAAGLCLLATLAASGLFLRQVATASATQTASSVETAVAPITQPVETETASPEITEPPTEFPTPIPTPTLITPIAYSPPTDGGQWAMTGGDSARTNFVYEGLGQLYPEARWSRFPQSGGNTGAVVAGGMVVFGLDGGRVRALNWTTGLTAWEASLGEGVELAGDPAIFINEEGVAVFVPTSAGELYALSLWDGSYVWSKSAEEMGGMAHGGVTVGGDGVVYALTEAGRFHAIHPFSGEIFWTFAELVDVDYFAFPSAVTGSGIFLPGGQQFLYAVDPSSVTRTWTGEILGSPSTPPTVAESVGVVVIGTEKGWVHAFWFDGTPAWSAQASNRIVGLATDNTRIYATAGDGTAYAWDVASGEQAWAVNTGGELTAAPLTDGNTVVIATHEGELRYFNATDGVEVVDLKISLGDGIRFAPAPAGGWLFVRAWNVYGVGP
jgi:serine/threonine-protein kinase